jgi:hypothetical protein
MNGFTKGKILFFTLGLLFCLWGCHYLHPSSIPTIQTKVFLLESDSLSKKFVRVEGKISSSFPGNYLHLLEDSTGKIVVGMEQLSSPLPTCPATDVLWLEGVWISFKSLTQSVPGYLSLTKSLGCKKAT